jgi:uncharacterized membrane protein
MPTPLYDIPKTIFYSSILILIAFTGFIILKKLRIKIDRKFVIGILPWILVGSTLRFLEDMKIVKGILFITPFVWFFSFSIFGVMLLLSILFERKFGISHSKLVFLFGILTLLPLLYFLKIINYYPLILILIFFIPWVIVLHLIPWKEENRLVTLAHLFDSNVTFIAINFFGYSEQHILPLLFIQTFSPIAFVFLKLVAIVTVLILTDKLVENNYLNNYLKLCFAILPIATGFRDFLRLLALV